MSRDTRYSRGGRFVAIAGLAGAAVFIPSAALAAEAEGCSGEFTSLDSSGAVIDSASAPGDGATRDDPFVLDTEGSVQWSGTTDAAITDGSWSVTIAGIQAFSGPIDDEDAEMVNGGNQSLAGLPAVVAAMLQGEQVIPAEGEITKDGAVLCTASGYITGTGSATSSPLFYGGVALAAVGAGLGIGVFAGTRVEAVGGAMA